MKPHPTAPLLLAFLPLPAASASPSDAAEALLGPHGIDRFPPLYVRALDDFVAVEDAVRAGEFGAARARLERLWADHPPATDEWAACRGDLAGLNVGSPPAYYALRMLTEVVRFETSGDGGRRPSRPITLTVLLVPRAAGIEPRDVADLERGTGRPVQRTLEKSLLEQGHATIHESLSLFREYV
ncbi:MAG: hypothetical protein ACF8XB_08765, partial [Planctomycetota bacterium JB042]